MSLDVLDKPQKSKNRKPKGKVSKDKIDHCSPVYKEIYIDVKPMKPTIDNLRRMDRESFIYESESLEEPEYKEWIWL